MKFRSLKLAGFKSFVDPTEVRLESGLTGVVGPNGCGKSNLFEAVRWVMGANSAKALRGAEMEDVIFAGTDRRPARNHAEVGVVLEIEPGAGPVQFAAERELEVVRRITRGQGSTYRINGKEVRARDVQLLFADASTGANSPSLVRQGQISELVNAKPQNRRRVLEEAAGIAGLHQRRHEAELKLRAAAANLDRAEDEMGRLDAEGARLKRQSRQAARYKRLAAEIRRTEALILHLRWVAATEGLAAAQAHQVQTVKQTQDANALAISARTEAILAQQALPEAREAEARAAAALRAMEEERNGVGREIEAAKSAINRLTARLKELNGARAREQEIAADAEAALARLAQEAEQLHEAGEGSDGRIVEADAAADEAGRERNRAEAELERLSAEAAEARARKQAAARHRADLEQRRDRLTRQIAAATAELAGIGADHQEKIEALRAAGEQADAAVEAARAALEAAETARADAEREARETGEAAGAARARLRELQAEQGGLERALAGGRKRDWTPALDAVRPAPGYERALAAALGEDLEAAIGGGAALRWDGAPVPHAPLPDGAAPLSQFAQAPMELAARLSQIGVVAEGDAAELAGALAPGQRLVTRAGHLWRWDGYVAHSDAPSPAAVRMEQRTRLEALAAEAEAVGAEVERLAEAADAAERRRRTTTESVQSARQQAMATDQTARTARRTLEQEIDAAAEAERARATAQARCASTETELAETAEALAGAVRAEAEVAGAGPSENELDMARDRVAETRDAAGQARDAAAALRAEQMRRAARAADVAREQENWRNRGGRATEQRSRIDSDLAAVTQELDGVQEKPEALSGRFAALQRHCEAAQGEQRAVRDALEHAEQRAGAGEAAARKAEGEHAALRESAAAAGQRVTDATERLAERREEILRQAECAPEELAERAGELMEANLDLAAAEAALETARRQRESIGEVNLRADTELEEIEGTRDRLAGEREDLAQAVAELRRGVDKLNGEGRQRLLQAFHVIDGHFQALFRTLFAGGEAHLALTESDDPLEAGLEIYACPPGKRLASLGLMSGGEQALTATALIFAVFLSNPSPLCVMDEVDAPLDDANVDRFCTLLDEMRKRTETHFMIITHNPVTMARMDRLYGVTMAERGASQLVSVDLEAAEQLAAAE